MTIEEKKKELERLTNIQKGLFKKANRIAKYPKSDRFNIVINRAMKIIKHTIQIKMIEAEKDKVRMQFPKGGVVLGKDHITNQ